MQNVNFVKDLNVIKFVNDLRLVGGFLQQVLPISSVADSRVGFGGLSPSPV
jgi:hypothetical protein